LIIYPPFRNNRFDLDQSSFVSPEKRFGVLGLFNCFLSGNKGCACCSLSGGSLLLNFDECSIHNAKLVAIDERRNYANYYEAKLTNEIKFFEKMQLSLGRGGIFVLSGICSLGCAWYALLWGDWEDWSSRVGRLRLGIGIAGLIAAFVLIGHGIFLQSGI
jgi:hypothetical protein